ncbi:protein LONGIFOLIA 2-like [Dorcoceras hygrometricum]|uniref:Protein LONGIFOLIA 2-like n=1 Tax=Dorcoceras hygrometricum TaxID=472368 RepID=A0A2Z7CDD7_9LAMI|nr:protein LONGIFOLIA 2-like [Dorcoceras hygrometricum]
MWYMGATHSAHAQYQKLHDLFANLKAYEFELETRAEAGPSTSQPTKALAANTTTEQCSPSTSNRSEQLSVSRRSEQLSVFSRSEQWLISSRSNQYSITSRELCKRCGMNKLKRQRLDIQSQDSFDNPVARSHIGSMCKRQRFVVCTNMEQRQNCSDMCDFPLGGAGITVYKLDRNSNGIYFL